MLRVTVAFWRDGAADPFRTTQAFRRKAEALGQRVVEGVAVGDLSRRGSSWQLATTQGAFEAPIIVNAAGAWADRIAARLGEPVPLEAAALMLMITAPMAAWIRPVVILRGRKLSFNQSSGRKQKCADVCRSSERHSTKLGGRRCPTSSQV